MTLQQNKTRATFKEVVFYLIFLVEQVRLFPHYKGKQVNKILNLRFKNMARSDTETKLK